LLGFDSIEGQRANRVESWKLWGSSWGVEMKEDWSWEKKKCGGKKNTT
jgi:hypothetical protein